MSHGKPLFTLSSAGELVPATAEEIIASAREHLTRRLRRGSSLLIARSATPVAGICGVAWYT